jgi:hypothetical protein
MSNTADAPKSERFAEFLRRLGAAPTAANFDEAYRQLCDTLNAVEDEMTSIPFDPSRWMTDGRLYPPQIDRIKRVANRPHLRRLSSLRHSTLIGDNGAIEIRDLQTGLVVFSKPGTDGEAI